MQLVVETSLFNPNAKLPPLKGRGNNHDQMPLATCHERDLQPLVNKALAIHKKLGQENFIHLMMERMKNDKALGEKHNSPFFYTFEQRNLARKSAVVTSWTIKTDIGMGSSRIDFNAFTTADLAAGLSLLALLSILVGYLCWSRRLCSLRKRTAGIPTRGERGKRRRKYSQVSSSEMDGNCTEDDNTVAAVVDGSASYQDDRSVASRGMTEMATIREQSDEGSSVATSSSLSTYLAKTASIVPS